ncbi:hypothetical protein [Streptosporangium sp. V21-05]|uniref:hypothetical protein n=1 Tax=Streptosporangium sp. V21-05 TaxID=3446115 RepID=UPI003F529559
MTTTHPPPTGARKAVSYFFTLLGILSGAWAARTPAVKHTLDLGYGQLSYGLLAIGLGTVLLAGQIPIAIAGFTLFGLGLAPILPQVFSAAGNHDPARAGQAIAQVATVGYAGLVAGPAVIGAATELVGLPAALGIPALLAAFMAASAGALRPQKPT